MSAPKSCPDCAAPTPRGGRRPDQERIERLAKAYALGELHDEGAVSVDDIVREMGPMTLGEVGVVLGVTRERIRQIEVKALAQLAQEGHDLERPADNDTWADAFEREAIEWL